MKNAKRWTALFLTLLALLAFAGCGQSKAPGSSSSVQIPNPTVGYSSPEEAARALGFGIELPGSVKASAVRGIGGTLLDLEIPTENGSVNLRKAQGSGDISGVYNEYDTCRSKTVNGVTVTLKGTDTAVSLAIWEQDGYTYSMYSESGLAESFVLDWVQSIR